MKKSCSRKSYYILEGCVGCGSCKLVCPIHCISKGKPYTIHAKKCIGCGQCVVRCRRKLIVPIKYEMDIKKEVD